MGKPNFSEGFKRDADESIDSSWERVLVSH